MNIMPRRAMTRAGFRILPLAVLALCLMATWLVRSQYQRRDEAAFRSEFDFMASKAASVVQNHLEANVQVLLGVAGLFAASRQVERHEFREYVATLLLGEHYPGIMGVGFCRLIPGGEKERHPRLIRGQGFPQYDIRPPGRRDVTTSIIYLEPFTGPNLRAFGYDMYSESVLRSAMSRARDEGKPAISDKVTLVQESGVDPQAGFLLYVPVYRNGASHGTVMERRANLVGWAYSPFRMKEMMQSLLSGKSGEDLGRLLDIHVYDGNAIDPVALMFDSEEAHNFAPTFTADRNLHVAGHLWTVRMHSRPPFEARLNSSKGAFIRHGGIGLSLLLALLSWTLVRSREKIGASLAQADQANRELKGMELQLRNYSDKLELLVHQRTVALERANRELELSRNQAEAANQAKSMFLAVMSHELRTPLNAILGLSEMLQEGVMGTVNGGQRRALATIEESGRHLLAVITDILDLSKIEADRMELELFPADLEEVCRSALRFVGEPAMKKAITLRFAMPATPKMVRTDQRRLKQVLVNLLGNAVKFTPEGGSIGLEVVMDEAQREVRFTVRDTGIGITPDDRKKLFHPFVQVDSCPARRFEGTGLGLALVARLTELMGGEVSVESEPGSGSSFIITLPWLDDGGELISPPSPETAPFEPMERFSHAPLILLVEDSRASREMLLEYLQSLGCRVLMAATGMEALSLARREQPELILMDIQMPVMDGLTAIREIRNLPPSGNGVAIIALTALAMPGDKERCLEAGADEYLGKPFRLCELQARIGKLLAEIRDREPGIGV